VYGGYSLAMVVLVIFAVILGNVAISYLDAAFSLRLDVTATRIYTMTDETETIVGNLDKDIYIYTLFATGSEDETVEAIVNRYEGLSMKVHTSNVDPERNPAFVKQFDKNNLGISTGSIIVTTEDQSVFKVIDYKNLYVYDSTSEEQTITMVNVESKLTSAIYHVLSGDTQSVIITQGHGEPSSEELSELIAFLQDENYDVTLTSLSSLVNPLTDEIVIVLNPLVDLTDNEQEMLRAYLDNKGMVILSLSGLRGDVPMPNVDSLLAYFSIKYTDGAIVETDTNYYQPPYAMYLLPEYTDHEIVSSLKESGIRIVMPTCGVLELPTSMISADMHVEPLLHTSVTSFLKTDVRNETLIEKAEGDPEGPFTIAVAAWSGDEVNVGAKMLVFTCSREAIIFPSSLSAYGNSDLVANSLAWMRGQTEEIFIRGKNVNASRLYFDSYTQVYACAAVCVIVIPLIFIAWGLGVYLRRRHL